MLAKSGVKESIIVISITFGIGHILNLFTGQAGVDTLIQILFAIAWGFIFTMVAYKSKSIWPCIIAHGFINASSKYAIANAKMNWFFIITTIITAVFYCHYLWKLNDKKTL